MNLPEGFKESIGGHSAQFGLTSRELYLVISAMNGVGYIPAYDPVSHLSLNISATADETHIDHEEFGHSLDRLSGDTPETPFEYNDLAEKLSKLTKEKALALIYYCQGFWAGRDFGGRVSS